MNQFFFNDQCILLVPLFVGENPCTKVAFVGGNSVVSFSLQSVKPGHFFPSFHYVWLFLHRGFSFFLCD